MRAFPEHRLYHSGLAVVAREVAGFDFLAHWHPDVELAYVLEGRLTVGVGDEKAALGPGELAVIASNAIHHYQKQAGSSRFLLVIFRPEVAGYPGIWPSSRTLLRPFWSASEAIELGSLMRQLVAEHARDDEFRTTVLRGLVTQLAGSLDRTCTAPAAATGLEPGPLRLRLAEAISFIRAGYQGPLTLEAVAAHVNLSASYFSRRFQSSCGTGFKAYLNALRVEEAERLLATTNRTILDIALACGFSGPRSMHRAFRTHRGRAPSVGRAG